MAKTSFARWILAGALPVVIALLPTQVDGSHIFGNLAGDPHQAHHTNPKGTSTLELDPVLGIHHLATGFLDPALAAQGFDSDGLDNIPGNLDDWTITRGTLSANSLMVELYKAYADTRPPYTCGTRVLVEETEHHRGGAAICLTYHPNEGDPIGADARWLQVIKTNAPLRGAQANTTVLPPFSFYIDNVKNPVVGDPLSEHPVFTYPFYELPVYTAVAGAYFSDRPFRLFPAPGAKIDWEAQVFITTGDLAARTLTIYDGAWWGFELETRAVPEPAAGILLLVGVTGVLAHRSRRSSAIRP
jgi:hypothetical protein